MSEELSSLNTIQCRPTVWFDIVLLLRHGLRCWSDNVQTLADLFTESNFNSRAVQLDFIAV